VAALSGRRRLFGIALFAAGLAVAGLISNLGVSRSASQTVRNGTGMGTGTGSGRIKGGESTGRQVTVFAVLATRNAPTADPRLSSNVKAQLRKILPDHGFKLLDVQSKNLEMNQALTSDLGGGYTAQTVLVKSLDENGKVQFRCNVAHEKVPEFTTLVKTPVNQLFFYERSLKNGTRVLIGVGAR
jgi:hypothetical protein